MRLAPIILLLSTTSAFALSEPTDSPKDVNVRTIAYDPANRVELVIRQGDITNITFQPMETIANVVSTDTSPFAFPQVKQGENAEFINNLPIIGKGPGAGNLVVITRGAPPNDKERVYNFLVRSVSDPNDARLTYQLSFTYPAQYQNHLPPDPTAPRQLSWREQKAAKDAEIYQARLRSDVAYGPQNLNYLAQGQARQLAPVQAFDNGALTAFRYPVNMTQPAFYKVIDNLAGLAPACQGGHATTAILQAQEEAVNTRVVNDLVVVDHTAPHWRVRSGENVIDIYNCGYDPIGTSTGTGTPSPDVVRRIVQR